jgi:hypothetical protein
MPYKYERKTFPVDHELIELAIERILGGESENIVCHDLMLSRATVQRHRKAQMAHVLLQKPGSLSSLPSNLEKDISVVARVAADNGFGISKAELQSFIADIVKRHLSENSDLGNYLRNHCKFVDGLPSSDYVTKFMNRNHLSLIKPSPLERCRSEAAGDPFIISRFYSLLEQELHNLKVENKAKHIWNVDETSFSLDPSHGKVVAEKGSRGTQRLTAGNRRLSFTVMACVAADGTCLPPTVIFPGKNLQTTWKGTKDIKNMMYGVSESGWMTTVLFQDWFKNFLKQVKERPLLLIFDGHKSHVNLPLIEMARQNSVTIIKLPSHTSDKLQPLDCGPFSPLKEKWSRLLVDHQRKTGFRTISKSVFVDLLCAVWHDAMSEGNIKSGFRTTGIYPFNPHRFETDKFNKRKLASFSNERNILPEQNSTFCKNLLNEDVMPPTAKQSRTVDSAENLVVLLKSATDSFTAGIKTLEMANFFLATSSSSQQTPSSIQSDLVEVFKNRFLPSPSKLPTADTKRRKINKNSAVITSEEFVAAITALDKGKQKNVSVFADLDESIAESITCLDVGTIRADNRLSPCGSISSDTKYRLPIFPKPNLASSRCVKKVLISNKAKKLSNRVTQKKTISAPSFSCGNEKSDKKNARCNVCGILWLSTNLKWMKCVKCLQWSCESCFGINTCANC